jgi:Ni/Fe-hydrogenase 1 B-type cytochrome subunit
MAEYFPTTPLKNRVREGAYSQAILPVGELPGPIYIYDAATRLWHWVTMLCIIALCITGYFIGSAPPSIGGEAASHYMFGWIRTVHFGAGMILGVAFLLRLYRVIVGGSHARQIFWVPFWRLQWYRELLDDVLVYAFLKKPKDFVGHNPLAHFAMFFMFLLPLIVLLLTGFAMFAEAAGVQSVWYKVFGWVLALLGDSMTVHTVHHVAMWVVILFSMVHMYMAIRQDMTQRQTTISAMVNGWRFYR